MWPSLLRKKQPSDKAKDVWTEENLRKFNLSTNELKKRIETEVSDIYHDKQQITKCIDKLKNFCMNTLSSLNENCTRENVHKYTKPLITQTEEFFELIKELKSIQKLEKKDSKRLSLYFKVLHNKHLCYSSKPKYKINDEESKEVFHYALIRDKHSEMSVMKMIDEDEVLEVKIRAGTLKIEHLKDKAITRIKTFEEKLPKNKIPAGVVKNFNHDMLGVFRFFDVVLENEKGWIEQFISIFRDDKSKTLSEFIEKSEILKEIMSKISKN